MKEFKIEIKREISEYLERLSFEISSRSDIITMLIENHRNDNDASVLSSEAFKAYSEQLTSAKAAFEIAKREFEDTQIPDVFKDHKYEWSLDYKTRILTIKLLCNCEVDYEEPKTI